MKGQTMKGQTMKLRNMSAYVTDEKNITIELANGEVLDLENAREMRKIAALGVDDEKEYAFAKGIVDGLPVENVNCEGCVLFGNGECSRLCALTHRVVTW